MFKQKVIVYIDGFCKPNPGRGGYAAVIIYPSGAEIELTGCCNNTTNNRMEVMGLIVALEFLDGQTDVTAFSDSRYLVNAVGNGGDGWLRKRGKRGWRRGRRGGLKNLDLWKRLNELLIVHSVKMSWVKGHAGDEMNERCDRLAGVAGR